MRAQRDHSRAGAGAPADALFDGFEEKRERTLAGAVWDDHAQRTPGQVQPRDLRAHEGAYVVGSEDWTGAAECHRHRSASRMAGPSAVKRCSAEATWATNARSAS